MSETQNILTQFLSKSGYEKLHFGSSEDIPASVIKSNAEEARDFLQKRLKQADIFLLVYLIMLIALFSIFVWFLITYKDKLNISVLLLGNGISAGVFGWIILSMKKIWKEKTIAELAIFTISSKEISIDELLKVMAILKDSQ